MNAERRALSRNHPDVDLKGLPHRRDFLKSAAALFAGASLAAGCRKEAKVKSGQKKPAKIPELMFWASYDRSGYLLADDGRGKEKLGAAEAGFSKALDAMGADDAYRPYAVEELGKIRIESALRRGGKERTKLLNDAASNLDHSISSYSNSGLPADAARAEGWAGWAFLFQEDFKQAAGRFTRALEGEDTNPSIVPALFGEAVLALNHPQSGVDKARGMDDLRKAADLFRRIGLTGFLGTSGFPDCTNVGHMLRVKLQIQDESTYEYVARYSDMLQALGYLSGDAKAQFEKILRENKQKR